MEFRRFDILRADRSPVAGAAVVVLETGSSTQAQIFDKDGQVLAQPLATNANGVVEFSTANGEYDIVATLGDETVRKDNETFLSPMSPLARKSYVPTMLIGGDEITTGGGAYSARSGSWTLIFGQVKFRASIVLSAKGTRTGNVAITLPFEPQFFSDEVVITEFQNLGGDVITESRQLMGRTLTSGSAEVTIGSNNVGTARNLTHAEITNTSRIDITGSYFVSAETAALAAAQI